MFDTKKFGGYLSRLRKRADMTQSELADKLNLTRQAISRYEVGDSFPDVSILVMIADIFGITLDELIGSGEPTRGESYILSNVARGNDDFVAQSIEDIVGTAHLLKPSVLQRLTSVFAKEGIDISGIAELAEYLNEESVSQLLSNANYDKVSDEMLTKFLPMLDDRSKMAIFNKIITGEMDWRFIRNLMPYADFLSSQVEAAVLEGALPWEALDLMLEARQEMYDRRNWRESMDTE